MPQRDPVRRLAFRVSLSKSRLQDAGAAERRALRSALGDTSPAAKVQAIVVGRDSYSCVRCGRSVIGIRASVHHRKRRSQGGANTPDNLITLCGSEVTGCHGFVHAHPAESLGAGWLVRSTADPALVPVLVISQAGSGMTVWLAGSGAYSFEPA
jgi:hypothetical protein